MPFVLKRKIKNFFKKEDKHIIDTAIRDVHTIITETSILLKYYYLKWFDNKKYNDPVLEIDKDLVYMAIIAIQNKKYITRDSKKNNEPMRRTDKEKNKNHYHNLLYLAKELYGTKIE